MKELKAELAEFFTEDPDQGFTSISEISDKTIEVMESDQPLPNQQDIPSPLPDEDTTINPVIALKPSKVKKYFTNLKTNLKKAAVWFNENKDKTLSDLMVSGWKEKCSNDKLQTSMDKCKTSMSKRGMSTSDSGAKCKKSQSIKEWINVLN